MHPKSRLLIGGAVIALLMVSAGALIYIQGLNASGIYVGPSNSPCSPAAVQVESGGNLTPYYVATESYGWRTFSVTSGTWSPWHYYCNKLVVNSGLDILSQITGDNGTTDAGSPVYLAVSTQTGAPAAGDTVCGGASGAYISNGFSIANALSSYSHTLGTSTYTLSYTWTYSTTGSVTFATACTQAHSGATAGTLRGTGLTDETNLSPTATVAANGDKLQLTATITV